jgi:sentrin-specific protease 7
MLQYVEQFLKNPIRDFRFPIKSLAKWFHQHIVKRKREEIAKLLQKMTPEGIKLPVLKFKTKVLVQSEEGRLMPKKY